MIHRNATPRYDYPTGGRPLITVIVDEVDDGIGIITLHQRTLSVTGLPVCAECFKTWPCPTRTMADRVTSFETDGRRTGGYEDGWNDALRSIKGEE